MSFIDDVTATYCEKAKFSNFEKQRLSLYLKMTIAENLQKNVFDLPYLGIFLRQFKLTLVVNRLRIKVFLLIRF